MMSDFLPSQNQIEFGAISVAIGGIAVKWIPACFKWLSGNLDKDHNDKFVVMNKWVEQLSKDVQEGRRESKEALNSVKECEERHNGTIKFMYEDRIKYEKQMAGLEAKIELLMGKAEKSGH